ncbi:MAG: GntR family transcriptional regulator [Rhodoglobus sp.]
MKIDPESTATLYQQLRTQIIEQIESGELIAGAKLPTVRLLASELGVAAYTVARVYRVLEQDGFLTTRGRNGTVVAGQPGSAEAMLQIDAIRYAQRAKELGITPESALHYVTKALQHTTGTGFDGD